ncbi:RidA family protein [Nocardioides panaciterrulae]|uniref:Enamine deaminase RidA (YjgF/YER057c/UK114 family) n=1 Tax=Nocardioides panaciterrulae TaxID=661492 RepID=A0A7Y9E918_9ACTN|nr:RidA family protein [Nocardioides panaciterrulae]NYD43242.1 enamine deaminase RidA (YjgF/YER057c/UK114 family) [Nocardioides panaciterrulae]
MSRVEARLRQAGLVLPDPPAPVAIYVPAVTAQGVAYTAGQLPLTGGELAGAGKVGEGPGLVTPTEANRLAALCALNAIAALKSVLGDLDRVRQVLKVVGYVASDPGFVGQPTVLNGASEVFGVAFGDAGRHARSAVGVAVLPLDAPVEVEVTVAHD